MKGLVSLGILLIVAWAVGFVVFKVAGFLIHLLLIVGAIMLLVGLIKRVSGGVSSST
ncbi:MAG: lmo0937 family membrane protein [Gemmatimonadales bacterium]